MPRIGPFSRLGMLTLNSEPGGERMVQDLCDDVARELGGAGKIERLGLGVFERDGDAGLAKKSPFDGGGHRAGVKHIDPRVGAGVEPADHDIGRLLQQFEKCQLDAIGRPPFHRPAHRRVVLVQDFLNEQRRQQRDRMADRTLLPGRRHHRHVAEFYQLRPQRTQARSINAVVIGQ